jgi:hypothetical protein
MFVPTVRAPEELLAVEPVENNVTVPKTPTLTCLVPPENKSTVPFPNSIPAVEPPV